MKSVLLAFFVATCSLIYAQDAKTYDSAVPNLYFDYSLKLVKETAGFSPPVAARAFGFMGLTLYEAVVPGMPGYVSMDGKLDGLNDLTKTDPEAIYHWPTVANNAMAMIVDSLFRTTSVANKDSLHKIRDNFNTTFEYILPADVFHDSKAFGEAIAQDIFDYSRTDGGHNAFATNFPATYVPPVGPDLWVPFGMQTALQPYWGSHRPFIEEDTIEAISAPPPAFSTEPGSIFYNYAFQVYDKVNNLTTEETNIALYWADGGGTITPAGHSISMLKNILTDENSDLEVATIAYAKLGIALSDAFLACWKTKFIYNLCRPVTYIRNYIDSTWTSMIGTPPFPEYPSGHSSQSGAMAEVLTPIFGENYAFTDVTHGSNFGGPRSFDSFDEAAQEAAQSRLYGGIHFDFGNNAGLALGTIVGENVNELFAELNVAVEEPAGPLANIQIYPNPAQDYLTIRSVADIAGTLYKVLDANGKVVAKGNISTDNSELNVSSLSAGLYLIQFESGNTFTYKFVKN